MQQMSRTREIDSLNEAEIDLDKYSFDDETVVQLFSKNELLFQNMRDYWAPIYREGQELIDYASGKIFDASTRAEYENVQNKICIEPRIVKTRINSLVGQLIQSRRGGRVVTEGPDSAKQVAIANAISKHFEHHLDENYLIHQMLFMGCLTGCPQALWLDRSLDNADDPLGGLSAEVLPWNSFVLQPYFNSPAGDDVHEIIRFSRKTKREVMDENPDREDEVKDYYKDIKASYEHYSKIVSACSGLTVEDANRVNTDILTAQSHYRLDGRILVFDRVCVVKKKHRVAVMHSEVTGEIIDSQIVPPKWSKRRVSAWMQENPEYKLMEKDVRLLWNTRWTREGIVLKNETHWFQEANLKGYPIPNFAMFVPQLLDGKPTGPGPDSKQLYLMKAIAETEFLHDVRTGSGDILALIDGIVKNAEDMPQELSRPNGIAVLDAEQMAHFGDVRKAIDFIRRTPNTSYNDYSLKVDADLDATDLISKSVQGQHVPIQSGRAKITEIAQAVVGYAAIAENFNKTYEKIKNLEYMMVPYCLTEEQIITIFDDAKQAEVTVKINEKGNDFAGNEVTVANDLRSVKWRYRLVPGDDSPTAKQAMLNEMLIFWNTTAPSLIQADPTLTLLASVLISMNNLMAKEIGRVMQEKAQVKAQQMNQMEMMGAMSDLEVKKAKAQADLLKAQRSGFSWSLTADDFIAYPELYKILVDANYINTANNNTFQMPPQQLPQQQPQQAVQMPAPGGATEGAM